MKPKDIAESFEPLRGLMESTTLEMLSAIFSLLVMLPLRPGLDFAGASSLAEATCLFLIYMYLSLRSIATMSAFSFSEVENRRTTCSALLRRERQLLLLLLLSVRFRDGLFEEREAGRLEDVVGDEGGVYLVGSILIVDGSKRPSALVNISLVPSVVCVRGDGGDGEYVRGAGCSTASGTGFRFGFAFGTMPVASFLRKAGWMDDGPVALGACVSLFRP